MNSPLYNINDVLYLRESAALGFLEAVRISGISLSQHGWVYTVTAKVGTASSSVYMGDRVSAVHGVPLYFSEDEFINHCDAIALVEANLQLQLDKIKLQRSSTCSDYGTEN